MPSTPDLWTITRNEVDSCAQDLLQLALQSGQGEQAHPWREIDQQIDVTVRSVLPRATLPKTRPFDMAPVPWTQPTDMASYGRADSTDDDHGSVALRCAPRSDASYSSAASALSRWTASSNSGLSRSTVAWRTACDLSK